MIMNWNFRGSGGDRFYLPRENRSIKISVDQERVKCHDCELQVTGEVHDEAR